MNNKSHTRYLLIAIRRFLRHILSIKEGTDIQSTIEGIKRDIGFRGPTAWILIFSIFIASIGLNINSTAVIIGAMLISPLMGPILGIGLSVGTNDFETLLRSLKNLGIAVSIALITSTLYFLITPLNIEQSELLARTKPTILDVMVALFGGFAGIVAGSRKEKSSVIPGVAIATALMPPLCTAGYGLATLKLHYFFGAFYLFFINSVFISLATFVVVRYLKFPLVSFLSPIRARNYRIVLISFLVVTVIPSAVIFYRVIQETRFNIASETFINEECIFDGSELISKKITYSDTLSTIDLYYIGADISDDNKLVLQDRAAKYGLSGDKRFPITKRTFIRVHQDTDNSANFDKMVLDFNNKLRLNILEDIYTKNEQTIRDKDLKIQLLEDEVFKLRQKDTIPFRQVSKELKFHFTEIDRYSFAKATQVYTNGDTLKMDTIPVFMVEFRNDLDDAGKTDTKKRISDWLQVRLNTSGIKVLEY